MVAKTLMLSFCLFVSEVIPRDISMKDRFIEHFTGKEKNISICFIFLVVLNISSSPLDEV